MLVLVRVQRRVAKIEERLGGAQKDQLTDSSTSSELL